MNTRRKRHRVSSYSQNGLIIKDDEEEICNWQKNQQQKQQEQQRRCNCTLETLPPEVFELILRQLPLRDVAGTIRLVSRQCSSIATAVLNGGFLAVGIRLESTMRYIKSTMPIAGRSTANRSIESDLLIWSRALNVVELIKFQYKMLKAVTWRYTHPPRTAKFNRLCFYAGTLIDELNSILDLARAGPHALSDAFNSSADNNNNNNNNNNSNRRDANIIAERIIIAGSPRLVSFVSLCKRFMNYFEKFSECKLNRSALVSGCKAVDVLDCLAEGREVTGFRISSKRLSSLKKGRHGKSAESGCIDRDKMRKSSSSSSSETNINENRSDSRIITMRIRYVMRRAWFTCLQVACAPDENSWREDQRFMYLRLRRLVGSVNEHYYEKTHFERDLMLLRTTRSGQAHQRIFNPPLLAEYNRPPPASTYSGYGVYAGRFFYYGNMNKYAYDSKFKDPADLRDESDDESGQDEGIDDEEDNENDYNEDDDDGDDNENNNNDDDNQNYNINSHLSSRDGPAFDLVIRVELRCSSDLAPLAVISNLRTSELDESIPMILDPNNQHCTNEENSELYLKMNITCPASSANRLPANFTWEQRGSDIHLRQKRRRNKRHRQRKSPLSSADHC